MKHLNLLIKPASSACNLRCAYCFYRTEANSRSVPNMGMMQAEVAEALLKNAFRTVEPRGNIHFSFQGGEPTLSGLSFYRDFVSKARNLCPDSISIDFSIQTNGIALDDAWIDFFRQENFLVGISIDGTETIHDRHRIDAQGNGSWAQTAQSLQKLFHAGVRTNVLCVVTKQCAQNPGKVYRTLKKLGATHLQFIACKDPLGREQKKPAYSLSPAGYGIFLCRLFDLWYHDWEKGQYRSIRLFDDYVQILMGIGCGSCATQGRCGGYYVVEGNGTVYPCDFYATNVWYLGNVQQVSFQEIGQSEEYRRFVRMGACKPQSCAACKWQKLCNGGCQNDWINKNGNHNPFCNAFRLFFSYASRRLRKIAKAELLNGGV